MSFVNKAATIAAQPKLIATKYVVRKARTYDLFTARPAAAVTDGLIPGTALYAAAVFFEAAAISAGRLLDGKLRPNISFVTWSGNEDAKPLLTIEVYMAVAIDPPSNLNVPTSPAAIPLDW